MGAEPSNYVKSPEFVHDFAYAAIVNLLIYFIYPLFMDLSKDPEKVRHTRKGYIMTTWIAGYSTVVFFMWWVEHLRNGGEFVLGVAELYGAHSLARKGMCMQVTYFILDCWAMKYDYYLSSDLQAWLHHILFMGFMSSALYLDCPNIFLHFFAVEFPTMILGFGRMYASQRRDILFQVTFFLCRIAYHAYLISLLYASCSESPMATAVLGSCMSFLLHCYWFYNVISKQYFGTKKEKSLDTTQYRLFKDSKAMSDDKAQ